MSRRLRLPTVEGEAPGAPTPEAMQRALGGRLDGGHGPRVGQCVAFEGRPVAVLLDEGEQVHVWVGQGRVRRVPSAALVEASEVPTEIAAVGRDIERFAALREGASVGYLTPQGGRGAGVLVERCRFGGLVAGADGRLTAVGFRRLWAEPTQQN